MTEIKTKRPFQQRVVDGFDRSKIHRYALKSKARRLEGLKKRYATLLLGASLAVGGVGIPMKYVDAHRVASEVTGGVESAVVTVASLTPTVQHEQELTMITERVREEFFRTEIPFGPLIYAEAKKNDLRPELVAAVVKTESEFKPTARSHRNAQGLMQLVPRTGKWMGADNLMNPVENVQAGTRYLKYLTERFDGDETKIIAAYNAGEGNVRKFDGVPPFKETQNYLKKVRKSEADFAQQVDGRVSEQLEVADASVRITR
ncbi:MAG TPA: lytic transglycosylase domain-containing protein [Thermoanaerobaculia bacterium]|nr:lytic transglycosylase domain-containing protein [Thermoanaerobaculia bacterium]